MSHALRVRGISHAYGLTDSLRGVDLDVAPGELVSLLGPSGCGKSTLLRVIAGLERAATGTITIGDALVDDGAGVHVPPERRPVGLVFQDFALFPHLTVADNVGFGLPRATRAARTHEMLELVALSDAGGRLPHELSGGEQQRVALARALAPEPRVLLLDEPFSGLDASGRHRVREETRAILRASGTASVLVTHDGDEAMQLCDRLVLMQAGAPVQEGTPDEICFAPATHFVARFFGDTDCHVAEARAGRVVTPFGSLATELRDGPVDLVVRHRALAISPANAHDATAVTVARTRLVGCQRVVSVITETPGAPWTLLADPLLPLARDQRLQVVLRPELVHIFAAS